MHFSNTSISLFILSMLDTFAGAKCSPGADCHEPSTYDGFDGGSGKDPGSGYSSNYGGAFGALKQPYYPPAADCEDYMIPIDIEYDNLVFNATKWEDNYGLIDFLTEATARAGAGYPSPVEQKHTKGSFEIAASFCSPKKKTSKAKNVIIATHGIGPARAHWNSPFKPEDYNFVQWAIGQGYSVFFYDRLGCGASQKVTGYEASIFTAIAILKELAGVVKAGKYTGSIGKPHKTAVMGFSFGSYTTHGAVATMPDIADAVVLTAIGFNETGLNANGLVRSFEPRIANVQNSALYGDLDNGYLTWVDKFGLIWNYFKKPNYEPSAADFVESSKAPFGIVEFLSFLGGPTDAQNYTGPVLAITGELDYIVCDGSCDGIFEEPAKTYYKNAKFTPYLQPGTSHHLNFATNATGAFKVITDFLASSGLN
ncbi:alpha/beta-hydrolase [Rhizodiscina lignyota]|uniref:Alpha/beta-hydrolase n=1 Tax=Rhizodiscina lignyota TaxID=1504668 RepID=A0A9P4IB82_9PEZI|nr:alpha/beta-hydrolase [Rhizodiscina lignyota]